LGWKKEGEIFNSVNHSLNFSDVIHQENFDTSRPTAKFISEIDHGIDNGIDTHTSKIDYSELPKGNQSLWNFF